MSKKIRTIRDVQPQKRNSNKHSQRGLGLLEDSIQRDGWIGAITVAADGETFDGSARVEVGAGAGFGDAIVVESDGSKPVIVRRTDIENADDPKAKRLGVAANRIAQIDFDPDTQVLADLVQEGIDLSDLYTGDEFDEIVRQDEANIERLNTTDEWVGMPDFEAGDTVLRIVVKFETVEEREQFAQKHELQFMKKSAQTWTTWWPVKETREDKKSLRYEA